MTIHGVPNYWELPIKGGSGSGAGFPSGQISSSQGLNQAQQTSQSTARTQSGTYIPDYSQTPILESIAKYAEQMAPQVYNWGMEQYGKNQGNIDAMMRNALTYGSSQRIASEVGKAEAGVQQGAEAGRQSAIRDLESYGIDPSSGRYQQLDNASRVMAGAAAAGAGNQQREATVAQGSQMAGQALQSSLANVQTGYGASNAMNQLLGTGMQLKYSPLGTTSTSSTDSYGQGTSSGTTQSSSNPAAFQSGAWNSPGAWTSPAPAGGAAPGVPGGGMQYLAEGGDVDEPTEGGFVSQELSPSGGSQVDDVNARLNSGEFVIPKDVAEWKGQEFFYKLMAQTRKLRATAGQDSSGMGYQEGGEQQLGYGAA